MTRLLRFLVLLGALSWPTLASAQAADPTQSQPPSPLKPSNDNPSSEPLRITATVTVTATRTESEVAQTPVSTSVVTANDLQARPVQNIDQQLTMTEGVYVQRFQGVSATDSTVSLRGFTGASRTLVLVDGHPVNDAYSGGVNWTGLPGEPIDRIEVARGPFSSLYGGNALGGVINIRTRPIDRRSADITGEFGTYDSRKVVGRFSDRYMGRLGFSLGFEQFHTDGYNSRRFTATPGSGTGALVSGPIPSLSTSGARVAIIGEGGKNFLDRLGVRGKVEYSAGSTVSSFQYVRSGYNYGYTGYRSYLRDASGRVIDTGAVVYDDGGTLRRLSITPNNFLQGPGEQRSNFSTGSVQHVFRGSSLLRVDASVYDIPTYQFRSLGTGNTLTSGPGSVTDGSRRTTHANVQYNWQVQQHALVLGAETRHESAHNEQFTLSNWTDKGTRGAQAYQADGRSFSQSVYLQDQFALADNLTLVTGGRFDLWRGYDGSVNGFSPANPLTSYPSRSNRQLSGKLALGYTLPGAWNVRVSAGNAFRNPNVFELYATSVTGSGQVLAGNPALEPELVKSWEAGLRKQLPTRTSIDAAYYETRVTNLIYRQSDLTVDPTGSYRINQNAGAGRTRGFEFSLRQPIVTGFEARVTYTRMDAVITSNPGNPAIVGKRVTASPDQTASMQLLAGYGKWSGSINGNYTGRVFSTDTNADIVKGVPGSYSPYLRMDASATYAVSSRIQPYVSIENLLNRRYYIFYLSPGRSVYAGVRVHL